VLRVVLDANL